MVISAGYTPRTDFSPIGPIRRGRPQHCQTTATTTKTDTHASSLILHYTYVLSCRVTKGQITKKKNNYALCILSYVYTKFIVIAYRVAKSILFSDLNLSVNITFFFQLFLFFYGHFTSKGPKFNVPVCVLTIISLEKQLLNFFCVCIITKRPFYETQLVLKFIMYRN